jgi:hypothetical protein
MMAIESNSYCLNKTLYKAGMTYGRKRATIQRRFEEGYEAQNSF